MAPPSIGFFYQYIFGGVIALIALLGIALCLRAHHQRAPPEPARALGRDDNIDNDLENGKGPPPLLYDAYLATMDGKGREKRMGDSVFPASILWHDIMIKPISLNPVSVGSCTLDATKYSLASTKVDADAPISTSRSPAALSAVAFMIAMPSPPDSPRDPENGEPPPLPYLEFGVADVEVPRERIL